MQQLADTLQHPSEPNYIASVGGDNFGDNSDNLNSNPSYVFSVVDLLEDKQISWAEYQEDMPYSGFTGFVSSSRNLCFACLLTTSRNTRHHRH